jgi:hypothetical protein
MSGWALLAMTEEKYSRLLKFLNGRITSKGVGAQQNDQ